MDTFTKIAKHVHGQMKDWKCRFCGHVGPATDFLRFSRHGNHGYRTSTCCLACNANGCEGRARCARKAIKSERFSIGDIPTTVGKASPISDWCEGTLLGFDQI